MKHYSILGVYFLSLFCFHSRSPCLLSLFLLFVFQSRSCSVVQTGLKLSSVGMTDMCHCAQVSGYIFYNHMLFKKKKRKQCLAFINSKSTSLHSQQMPSTFQEFQTEATLCHYSVQETTGLWDTGSSCVPLPESGCRQWWLLETVQPSCFYALSKNSRMSPT